MKEYDCSKILDYTHEVQRLCEDHKIQGCDNCPLMKDAGYCSASIFDITQERINFIQKWSDEHREKTRKEAFREIFPMYFSPVAHELCFNNLIGAEKNALECGEIGCEMCWDRIYNGEFEKAREEKNDA